MFDQLERRVRAQVTDVVEATCHQVVDHENLVLLRQKAVTKVGTDESGPAGYKNTQTNSSMFHGKARGVKGGGSEPSRD